MCYAISVDLLEWFFLVQFLRSLLVFYRWGLLVQWWLHPVLSIDEKYEAELLLK